MSRAFAVALLIAASGAVVAEILAVAMVDKVMKTMEKGVDEQSAPPRFMFAIAVLSILYIVAVVLLFFSGDEIFTVYAWVLTAASLSGWFVKKYARAMKVLVIVDACVCLIILLDVIRTVLRFL